MHVWSHEEQSELKDGGYQLKNGTTDKVDTEPFTAGILYYPCLVPTSAGSSKKQERPNGHEFEWTLGVGDGQGRPGVLRFMGSERVRHN